MSTERPGPSRPDLGEIEHTLIHHTELPRTAISDALDRALALIGKAASWFWLAVVAVILYAVVSRYAFNRGSVTLEEVQWHIASAVWLIGLSYAVVTDDHVRVDVLHERFGLRRQTWIECLGILFLLLPFLVIAFWEALPYFLSSWQQGERSQAPAGLPARWLLKLCLVLSFALLAVAATSRLLRCTALLFGWPSPRRMSVPAGGATVGGEGS